MSTYLHEIAGHLPHTTITGSTHRVGQIGVTLNLPALPGARLTLSTLGGKDKGRVSASLCGWPTYRRSPTSGDESCFPGPDVTSHVTFAANKTPEAAAREITRRLLVPMEPEWVKLVASAQRWETYYRTSEADARRLCDTFGGSMPHRSHGQSMHLPGLPSVRMEGGAVRFEYFSVPTDTAIAILQLIREARAQESDT